jgi:hypothetical protein
LAFFFGEVDSDFAVAAWVLERVLLRVEVVIVLKIDLISAQKIDKDSAVGVTCRGAILLLDFLAFKD